MAGSTQGEVPSQVGKTIVVTGATGGLGFEMALALAKAGADVILTGRDDGKGQSAIEKIGRQVTGAKVNYERLDLASLASIADFAQRMAARRLLDLLINNAGVMALPRRQVTADGFEMQFGTNHLGHFALTARLMPLLRRADGSRVVSVSSLAHRTGLIDFNDLQGERLYSPWKAYGQSKLACLMFALELQRRSEAAGWNVISNAAHPGFARTNLFSSGPGGLLSLATDFAAPFFAHSAADGARPILVAATSPEAGPGTYYGPGGLGELRGAPARALIMPQARNSAAAASFGTSPKSSRVHRSNSGLQMQLAKPVIDVGLSTNNLEPMLRFWQQDAGIRFDHVLPVRRGQKQYRHDEQGSVVKINHTASRACPEFMNVRDKILLRSCGRNTCRWIPYMRARMEAVKSYAPHLNVGNTIIGQSICDVVSSHHPGPGFQGGDIVLASRGGGGSPSRTGKACASSIPNPFR